MDIDRQVDQLLNRKNGNRSKKHKQFWLMLGLSIVTFILGTMLVLPIFDDRRGIDILLSYLGGDDVDVGEEVPPEPEAYHYWYAPEDSFGISSMKTVNWSWFKQLFLNHTDWMLEYKRYEYSDWTNGDQYMTIERTWNDTGFWKFNLIFDVPVHVYSARFTFGIDLECLQYVERDGYEVWINYSANATETYSCMFNWSDIASIPNLVITKGVQNNMFWFRFRRDDIPAGYYEFDPTFGHAAGTGGIYLTRAGYDWWYTYGIYASPVYSGICDNMTIKIIADGSGSWSCALYEYVDYSTDFAGNLLGTTEQVAGTAGVENVLNFNDPKPNVVSGTNYYLMVNVSVNGTSNRLAFETGGNIGMRTNDDGTMWTDPLTGESSIADSFWVYCSYTASNLPPVISNPSPVNNSLNSSISPTVNVTVTDQHGNNSVVDFYTSTDGDSWTWRQTNTSVLNESVSYVYSQANEYQTTYYWRATANDSEYNTTSDDYNFETTPYRATYFNDTFPNENYIQTTYNMTHEAGWENFSYALSSEYVLDETMTANTYDINLDMYDSTYDYGPSPRVVFTDKDTGYAVGMDTSGSDEPHLYKTVDGGETWTDEGTIDSASDPTDGWAGAMWYDQWTNGGTGTKIHLAYIGDDTDDLEYNFIDTTDDSFNGTWGFVHSWAVADGGDGSPAICNGTDGILWIGGFGSTTGEIYNSSNDGATWTASKPATLFDDDDDGMQLFPMENGDIMCVYYDWSATDIGYFRYWQNNNTWSGFTVIDTYLSAPYSGFTGSMLKSTGDIYIVFNENDYSATSDIVFYTYTVANDTWWGDIKLETDAFGYTPGITIHEGTGDLYVWYEDGSADAMDIYYQRSTDGGQNWNARTKINTVTDDNRYCLGNFMSNETIYATWVNEDLNDWHGNILATYVPGKENAFVSSVEIFKPDGNTWDEFYADVNDTVHCSFALSDNNTHYNITSGLTGNGDDISSVTNGSVYIYANFSVASVNMGSWNITWTSEPAANNAPTQTGESPSNESTGIDVSSGVPDLYVICNDADGGDTLTATWSHNATDDEGWVDFATNSSISPATNITQSNANFSTESTKYWWKVNLTDGTDWANATYHFTTAANVTDRTPTEIFNYWFNCGNTSYREPTQVFDYWFECGNTSERQPTEVFNYWFLCGNETQREPTEIFNYWFSCGNGTVRTPTNIFDYWFNCGNGTTRYPTQIFDYWFNCGNTSYREPTEVFNYWFDCGNTSTREPTEVFNYWFLCGNETQRTPTLVFDYWFSCGNVSADRTPTQIFDYWFSCGNVTITNITITSPYPTNGSTDVQVNTSLYFTVSNALGYLMNITIYTGSNLTNCSALLGSFNSVANGTYYLGYHNASEVSTEYAWRVNVSDGNDNYADETYNFTTASTVGAIYTIGVGRYTMGMIIIFSAMFVMMGLSVVFVWKRKKEKINRR